MVAKRGIAVFSGSGNTIHKFIDDGDSQIGAGSEHTCSVQGLINLTGDLTASSNIKASYFLGNGSQLTGIAADSIDTTAANDDVTYYLPFVSAAGTQTDVTIYNDTGGDLEYNPSTATLTTTNVVGTNVDGILGADTARAATVTTLTANTSVIPDAAGGADLGSTTAEWGDVYIADDKKLQFGSDQDATIEYDADGTSELRFAGAAVTFEQNASLDADVTLGLTTADTVTVKGNSTFAGTTIADLGTVSAATSITATDLVGTNVDGILGADTARAATVTTLTATGDLTVSGDSTLGDANADVSVVSGSMKLSMFDGTDATDQATLRAFCTSSVYFQTPTTQTPATQWNGHMIYVGNAYAGESESDEGENATAYFSDEQKWYFCESGSWYPSPFNS